MGFALLCAAVLIYWGLQYHPFVLPNNDYYSFERTARSFSAFELPRSFKRMPILPALMALLAPLLPGPHPYLDAALIWNQVFSLAVLAGLFLLGHRLLGRSGLLLPVLFAGTTQFHANGLQPLVEPSLGFFSVWAFLLHAWRSPWKYAAAAGAALSRYEAALLIPVLFAADVLEQRRLWRPLLPAGLASSGLLVWAGLGALHGSGGASYYDLMSGMGFQPAPGFFLRSLKEPFAGWYTSHWVWMIPFVGVVGLPLLAGIGSGLREDRREVGPMLAFGLGCVATIVAFGINKARYVYPTEWIWLLLWLVGAVRMGRWIERRLLRSVGAWAWGVAGLCGLLSLVALGFWLAKMASEPQTAPRGLELAYLFVLLGLAGVALWPPRREGRAPAAGAALASALFLATLPLLAGGIVGKQRAVHKIYHANWSAHLLADWLRENLRPDDRVALLPRSPVLHLTGLPSSRLVAYAQLDAHDLDSLIAAFRRRGITLAVYTDRGPLRNPSHHYYYREKKTYLAELFESGGPVPGFEHLATLPLPASIQRKPVQIYRLREISR